ncbi:extracellular solute-binding protein [Synechococcales cyanobacterium C]|uniref:Extracellular solute-binding protein n=1 Tax=Petrachloros mirabilis ULC683 TaxID=2781853 RepID=A0A8K2A7J7_9CYAN|nr:ABC transporter substrate-binding protein [Petrachloros mirabilis]NCJ06981.1 extracellular solute-binding protein [Petrachloros mirabilis ULC683]
MHRNWLRWLASKKVKSLLMAVILFVSSLSLVMMAVAQQQPIRLTMMLQASELMPLQELVRDFEAENPDIRIELIEGPDNTNLREDLYTTAFLLGDSAYDLVYMDIAWVPKFAAAGWLLDISSRLQVQEREDFLSGDIEGGSYEGKLYRMPFRSDGGMLYYRQDLLEEAGYAPPDTTEELLEISQDLQAQGKAQWGYVWQGQQYEGLSAMFVEILHGFGGLWVDPDTLEVGLDQPQAIAAVNFLKQTIAERVSPSGVTSYQEEEARRVFQSGQVVFMRNWPYVWRLASEEGSPIRDRFGIKPMVHAPGYSSGACQGGWGIGIAKTTRHPDAAYKAAAYFASPEAQKKFILESGFVPSRRSLFTDPELVAAYEYLPDLLEVIDNSVLRPPIAQYAQASDVLQRYLSAALTNQRTPERAMEAAARETRQLLQR